MSTMSLALEILGRDLTGGAFASVLAKLGAIEASAVGAGNAGGAGLDNMGKSLLGIEGAAIGAGIAFIGFSEGMKAAIETGAQLQNAAVMATIAISDGTKHVQEIEDAIVNFANTSQYKIADVDMAFRVLGGLGFDTKQILGGLAQQALILAQAMGGQGAGVSAADAAQLLGQAIYIFGNRGLTAAHAADVLTGAFYNNMMSVSDLTQFMGMAGGTAASLGVSFDQLMTFGSMLTPMFGSASSAGASLSYMMRNLAHPATSKMADEIKHLGLQVYDSNGKFVGLKSIMDQLFADTKNMTDQQKMDVFGTLFNVRSGRAAMDMMSQTQQQFDQAYTRINGRLTQVGQAQRDSTDINNTGIGTWNRLSTTVNDFFAKAGVGIVTALIPLANSLNNLFSQAQKSPILTQFFAVFLVGGTVIAALTLIALALVAAFVFFAPIAVAVVGVLVGIVAAAGELALIWTILHTKTDLFHGSLSFLNPLVTQVRNGFSALGDIWRTQILPSLQRAQPLWDVLGKVLLVVAGIILGVVIGAILFIALTFTGVMLVLGKFLDLLGTIAGNIGRFAALVEATFQLIHDVVTGNWGAMSKDLMNVNTKMTDFVEGQTDFMAKKVAAAHRRAADEAKAAALAKQAAVVQATEQEHRKAAKEAEDEANKLIYEAKHTKDEATKQALLKKAETLKHAAEEDTQVANKAKDMHDHVMTQVTRLKTDSGKQAQQMQDSWAATMGVTAVKAIGWGRDLVQNLINGITSMFDSLKKTVGNIANIISNLLHHSTPDEGPLAGDDQWGAEMVHNFASSMVSALPTLRSATGQVASTISGGLPTAPTGAGYTPVGNFSSYGGGQQVVIPIYIDDNVIAEYGYNTMTGQLTMNGMGRQLR